MSATMLSSFPGLSVSMGGDEIPHFGGSKDLCCPPSTAGRKSQNDSLTEGGGLRLGNLFAHPPSLSLPRPFPWAVFNNRLSELFFRALLDFPEPVEDQPSVGSDRVRKFGSGGSSIMKKMVHDFMVDVVNAKGVRIYLAPLVGENL